MPKILVMLFVGLFAVQSSLAMDIPLKPDVVTVNRSEMQFINDAVEVTFLPDQDWPGIKVDGPWDFSEFDYLQATVKNTGDAHMRFCWQVNNTGYNGVKNCIVKRFNLNPGEERVITLELFRKVTGDDKVVLKGMHSIPEGLPKSKGIDVSKVVSMIFFTFKSRQEKQALIKDVKVLGKYRDLTQSFTFPFVDTYGQFKHADWPDKIHDDQDITKHIADEKNDLAQYPQPQSFNAFGGWENGPTLDAKGHFYVTKYKNKWTMVDPTGKLFFSLGMNHVNIGGVHSSTVLLERENWFDQLPSPNSPANQEMYFVRYVYSGDYSGRFAPCFSYIIANLKRKWGHDWQDVGTVMAPQRLKSWGFNTIGNWSDTAVYRQEKVPFTLGTAMAGASSDLVGGGSFKVGSIHDPYDPEFKTQLAIRLNQLKSLAQSPWCIGVFVDNELYWDLKHGEMTQAAPKNNHAKLAMLAMLQHAYPSLAQFNTAWGVDYKDWSDWLENRKPVKTDKARMDCRVFDEHVAEKYYQTVRDVFRQELPGKLYLGSRFARVTPTAYRMAVNYCDVVTFNIYQTTLRDFLTPTADDAPLLVGEFHFGARDQGMFGTGLVPVPSQKARAEAFTKYVNSALEHKQFVGCHWFQYYDQPVTGRAFDGENANIGYLNNVDAPYPEMIKASREVAQNMYQQRFGSN
jgi:hypothetical protein